MGPPRIEEGHRLLQERLRTHAIGGKTAVVRHLLDPWDASGGALGRRGGGRRSVGVCQAVASRERGRRSPKLATGLVTGPESSHAPLSSRFDG